MQSIRPSKPPAKLHVGVIMDGNGRWASRRGLPRNQGHEAGVRAIGRLMEAAPDQGVGVLTLYAFSADNWRRPAVLACAWYLVAGVGVMLLAGAGHTLSPWFMGVPFAVGQGLLAGVVHFASGDPRDQG